ncbi:MAG TPA: LLM class flavin-dependent oxidoreductase [Chloroflexia bacterium]|nr:LLM class flavin-dependent oxidoreductase [Chloroflexia bacterium]
MSEIHAGLVVNQPTAAAALAFIRMAESHGVPMVWSTVAGIAADPLTLFGAAATQTSRIAFGTAIVPTYPRHPAALAGQALALEGLAPGRLRLGIGPSHKFIIADMLGIPFDRPLEHLREYLTVLRGLLWDGKVDFQGRQYRVRARLAGGAPPPRTPLPIAALRAPAFQLAGELADGAISWLCPIPYLVQTALPALRAGAEAAGRPVPPLIGHVPVAMHGDRAAIRAAALPQIGGYARAPFYARMFADAGFPVPADGRMPDALIDELVVAGDAPTVAARLRAIRAVGVDELLITVLTVADAATEEAAAAAVVASL